MLIVIATAACNPPVAQVATTEQAITAASTPEVDTLAAASLQGAVATLDAARQEIAAQRARLAFMRRYGRARALLDSATHLARDAVLVARAKAGQRDADRDLADALATIAKLPADTAATWLNARRRALTTAERSLAAASEALAGGRFAMAADSFAAVAERVRDALADVKPTALGVIVNVERRDSVKYYTYYLTISGLRSEESRLKATAGQELLVISFYKRGDQDEVAKDRYWVADSAGTRYRHKKVIGAPNGQQVVYEIPAAAVGLTWNDGSRVIKL